jgi:hypothetical protein
LEVRPIDRNQPVVDSGFKPLQNLQIFCTQVRTAIAELYTLVGSVSGGFVMSYTSKTASYTVTDDDFTIDCTSGTFDVTLLTSVGRIGKVLNIKNSGTGVITVNPDGTETIDGSLTAVLSTQYESITIQSNGANWVIL